MSGRFSFGEGAGDGGLPEVTWIDAADKPWGVRLLDVRPVTLGTRSSEQRCRRPRRKGTPHDLWLRIASTTRSSPFWTGTGPPTADERPGGASPCQQGMADQE